MDRSEAEAGNVVPDPRRAQLHPVTVPQHGLTRYLRVRLEVTDGVVRWEMPRRILGVVPIGTRHVDVPIGEVRSLRVRRVVHPIRLLAGAACIVVPLTLTLWWAAVPLTIFGLWLILVSFGPHLEMVTRSGTTYRAAVCFGHQIDAELYADAVGDLAAPAQRSTSDWPDD